MLNSQTPLFGRERKGKRKKSHRSSLSSSGKQASSILHRPPFFAFFSFLFRVCGVEGTVGFSSSFSPSSIWLHISFSISFSPPHIAWKSRSKRKRGKEGGGVGAAILSSRSHVAAPLPSPLPCAFSGKEKGEGGKTFFRSILHPYLSPLPPSAGKPKGEKKPFSFPVTSLLWKG